MFKRTYLGLDIRCDALNAVGVQRRGKKLVLTGIQTTRLAEGVVRPGYNSPNIVQPECFVEGVKALLGPLIRRDNRIAVALPDSSGHLFIIDVETPFKNRTEGAEIIRWQLKDLLPERTTQMALDYQVLNEMESGQKQVLVAAISRDVLLHYEALIEQAGFAAEVIDFHSLALYNAYRSKVDFGRDFILVGIDGRQLSVQVFVNEKPFFSRNRKIEQSVDQVFQEINRSLVGCRSELPNFSRIPVYLHTDWSNDELSGAVDAVFEQSVQCLTSPVSKLSNGHQFNLSDGDIRSLATALGVVERMIPGVS